MKRIIVCFFLLFSQIFPQGNFDVPMSNEGTVISRQDGTQPFLFRNRLKTINPYRQENGRVFSYTQTREIVSLAPNNEDVLRQERVWRTFSRVSGILACASLFAEGFYHGRKALDSDESTYRVRLIVTPILGNLWFGSLLISRAKLQRSVDNYNFHIAR